MRPAARRSGLGLAALATLLAGAASPASADDEGGGYVAAFCAFWEREEVVATGKAEVLAEIGYSAGAKQATRTPKITASGFNKWLGNRPARNALAQTGKRVAAAAKSFEEALRLPLLATLVSLTDTASSAVGRVSERDFVGASAELAKEGGKQLSTAAGAAAGGKLFAMLGAPFGPVVAGAAAVVGAAGGAAVTAVGYDAYLSDWVGNSVEADRKTKEDYIEDARESLRTFPERRARERVEAWKREAREEAEARWREEWKVVEAASGYGDWNGGEVALLPERVMSPPPVAPAPDASRPVIFDDCTIDVTVLHADRPGDAVQFAFDVRGDTVTGRGEGRNSGSRFDSGYTEGQRWTARFDGTLNDNVVTGLGRITMHTARSEHSWTDSRDGREVRRTCVVEWDGEASARETWTFLMGGEGQLRSSGRSVTRARGSMDCDASLTRTTESDYTDEGKLRFTWRVRGR